MIYFGELIFRLPSSALISFVVGAFFLIGPTSILLRSGPTIGKAMSSLRHLEGVGLEIKSKINERAMPAQNEMEVPTCWKEIRAEGLCYRYPHAFETDRMIGPFDLSIKRGELIFIVGGVAAGCRPCCFYCVDC